MNLLPWIDRNLFLKKPELKSTSMVSRVNHYSYINLFHQRSKTLVRPSGGKSTGCSLNIFFPRILESLPPLLLALGCYWLYKNYQPIGVTVHSHCVESFERSLIARRGRGCSESWKNTFFPEHPLYQEISIVYDSNKSLLKTCLETFIKILQLSQPCH